MNFFLTWAFVPLLLAAAFRYILAQLNSVPWHDTGFMSAGELYTYGACLALALLSLWHHFGRDRCPECRAVKPTLTHEKEVERFIGTKKVHGKDGQGRTTTHHVSTTYARMEYHYACSNAACKSRWYSIRRREVS